MKLSYQIQAMHPMLMPTTFLVQRGGVWKGNTERRPAFLFYLYGGPSRSAWMYVLNMIDILPIDREDARQSGPRVWQSAIILDSWQPYDWLLDLVSGSLFLSLLRAERSHRRGWFSLSKNGQDTSKQAVCN